MRALDLRRRAGALVGERRRHADVEHDEVGRWPATLPEPSRVAERRRDLVARVGEQPHEPVAQEHLVLGDHDPHGNSASGRAGTGVAVDVEPPPWAATRSRNPLRPDPFSRAPPMPSSRPLTTSAPFWRSRAERHGRGVRMLDRVGEAFAGDEVRGGLDADAEALVRGADRDRQWRAAGQLAQRRLQAGVELRRRQALGQLAQLADRRGSSGDRVVDAPPPSLIGNAPSRAARDAARARSRPAAAVRRRAGRARSGGAPASRAATIRAREASTSASWRRSSTRSRTISIASPPAVHQLGQRICGCCGPAGPVQDDGQRHAGARDRRAHARVAGRVGDRRPARRRGAPLGQEEVQLERRVGQRSRSSGSISSGAARPARRSSRNASTRRRAS